MFASKKEVRTSQSSETREPSRRRGSADESANPAWHRLATRVQAQLTIFEPGDAAEEEAEQVSKTVMRSPGGSQPAILQRPQSRELERVCENCEEEENVQREARGANAANRNSLPHPSLGSGLQV